MRIHFRISTPVLTEPLAEHNLLRIPAGGRHVIIQGKASALLYAHAAYAAVHEKAAKVSVCHNQEDQPVVVYEQQSAKCEAGGGDAGSCWYSLKSLDAKHYTIEFNPNSEGPWPIACLRTQPIEMPHAATGLSIRGRGELWMYAAAGAAAARAGIDVVLCDLPSERGPIFIGKDRIGRCLPRMQRTSGIVIGVVGDSNTGKSAFARILEQIIQQECLSTSWLYDCDVASPTPNGCPTMLKIGEKQENTATRNKEKVRSPHLELYLADCLKNLKACVDIVVADLPGGNHKPRKPDRIPRGREITLREIDLFIVLGRTDRPGSIRAWREGLRRHNLERRIIAELETRDPDGKLDWALHRGDGLVEGIIRGLGRKNKLAAGTKAVGDQAWELLRHLRACQLAQLARAATSQAFLTKPGGVRYGAAVLCRDGERYSAGQYSSFNHSTNVHAEQAALVVATSSGRADVVALALACTEPGVTARPCGVCRQVMLEHALRTGRDFDVIMTADTGRMDIQTVSQLLPLAWASHQMKSLGKKEGAELRTNSPVRSAYERQRPLAVGDLVFFSGSSVIAMVWEPFLSPGKVLVKIKYQRKHSAWVKLPHSLTEPFAYERALHDLGQARPTGFGALAAVVKPEDITEVAPCQPIWGSLPKAIRCLLESAGISREAVVLTCSRALGLAKETSDFDLVVTAQPGEISRFRSSCAAALNRGKVSIPARSGTWKLLDATFPGGRKEILRQRRFLETLQAGGSQVAIIFVPPDAQPHVLVEDHRPAGRIAVFGIVTKASHAAYKRSVFEITCLGGQIIEVVVYFKLGNLVLVGDHLALHGWLLEPVQPGVGRKLILLSPAADTIAWLAPPGREVKL